MDRNLRRMLIATMSVLRYFVTSRGNVLGRVHEKARHREHTSGLIIQASILLLDTSPPGLDA